MADPTLEAVYKGLPPKIRAEAVKALAANTLAFFLKAGQDALAAVSSSLQASLASGEDIETAAARIVGTAQLDKGPFSDVSVRALLTARTEIHRAVQTGMLKVAEQAGVKKGTWVTMYDRRVCPECAALNGMFKELDKFGSRPPIHPRCRCLILPGSVSVSTTPMRVERAEGGSFVPGHVAWEAGVSAGVIKQIPKDRLMEIMERFRDCMGEKTW